MEGMSPWGGCGANPRPRHWQAYHARTRDLLSGSFPYSEGQYEDLNKVLMLQWGWAPERRAEEIIREYAASYFSPDVAEDVLAAVLLMEEHLGHEAAWDADGLFYRTTPLSRAEDCFDLVNRADGALPEEIRQGWRWRLLWLRAAIDAELKRSGGRANECSDRYAKELIGLYRSQEAHDFLRVRYRNDVS